MSVEYAYYYDDSGSMVRNVPNTSYGAARPYAEAWQYDAETRRVIARNVERSFLMDGQRARMAPTASQVRARVLAQLGAP